MHGWFHGFIFLWYVYSNYLVILHMACVGKTSMAFYSITNLFLQVMALLIVNLSLQNCYSKGFTMNSHFHSKCKSFPLWMFPIYGIAKIQHFSWIKESMKSTKFEPYGNYQSYGNYWLTTQGVNILISADYTHTIYFVDHQSILKPLTLMLHWK